MNLIEVFVEDNCASCDEAIETAEAVVRQSESSLRIFDRFRDSDHFHRRRVLICPATFVNRKLVFYGSFTQPQLRRYLRRNSNDI